MKSFLSIVFLFVSAYVFATHNRAGEITYRQLSDLTYEITVETFTYTLSPADRPELEVQWGDNTSSIVERHSETLLPNDYKQNIYIGTHTYPGPGTYIILMEDPNRNYGVKNIPNSVNVVFSIKTTLQINPEIGYNNTPILLNPPIDKAAKGHIFIHNPAAFDPDGDSLSYRLGVCTGEGGQEIFGYTLPAASNKVWIDSITGDFIWDSPVSVGIYNVAIIIEEWRNGIKIGKIIRDMQIEVLDSDNNPPVIDKLKHYCIGVDDTLSFIVHAWDPDNDVVTLEAQGGPLSLPDSLADFTQPVSGVGEISSEFVWKTNCSHVRKQNYQVTFKATDNNYELNLVDIKNATIQVVGPPPELVSTEPTNNSVKLSWNQYYCSQAAGFYIYRRTSSYNFTPDECETGVPSYTGYEKIATIDNISDTTYIDNDNGNGLNQGYEYCYRITAYWDDNAESYSSNELCTPLVRGIPIITNVSIRHTDNSQGSVYVAWAKPIDFDTINAPGPYQYLVYRANNIWGNNLSLISTLNDINDTIFIDTLLNTKDNPWAYKVEFYNNEAGNRFLIGSPQVASSVFLNLFPGDNHIRINFEKNVPWINNQYVIYRQNSQTASFDSIGITNSLSYTDSNLKNGAEYCYRVKSTGGYQVDGIIDPLINFSEVNCSVPIDTVKPCQPPLQVISKCDSMRHELIWQNPNHICSDDVVGYNIYYSPGFKSDFILIASKNSAFDTTLYYSPELSMAGCYYVTALDSFSNESTNKTKICIDNCTYYVLPNVFTPDGNNINDIYHPGPYKFVEKVDMKIFDRWGVLIFETSDPDINWDGTYQKNKKMVTDGVYFYICDVYERRLTGIEPRTLTGFIHVLNNKQKTNN